MSVLSFILSAYRAKKRLGLRGLAREIGIPHTTLYTLEQGKPSISLETTYKVWVWMKKTRMP